MRHATLSWLRVLPFLWDNSRGKRSSRRPIQVAWNRAKGRVQGPPRGPDQFTGLPLFPSDFSDVLWVTNGEYVVKCIQTRAVEREEAKGSTEGSTRVMWGGCVRQSRRGWKYKVVWYSPVGPDVRIDRVDHPRAMLEGKMEWMIYLQHIHVYDGRTNARAWKSWKIEIWFVQD